MRSAHKLRYDDYELHAVEDSVPANDAVPDRDLALARSRAASFSALRKIYALRMVGYERAIAIRSLRRADAFADATLALAGAMRKLWAGLRNILKH